MRTVQPQVRSLLSVKGAHCWCKLWKITRGDGTIFRFTDHNRDIKFDGETYVASKSSPSGTASQSQAGVESRNLETRGAISSGSITEEDLRTGKFRGSRVLERVVDWRFPWAGVVRSDTFIIEETICTGTSWTAKLVGLTSLLKANVGWTLTRSCRFNLGDEDCQVDLGPLTITGAVSAITEQRRLFTTNLSDVDDYFVGGELLWTSGANTGLRSEIKAYSQAGGILELQLRTEFDIVAADDFEVVPGCDKTRTTCIVKFDNVLRFGGFPDIPGNDKLYLTPDVK